MNKESEMHKLVEIKVEQKIKKKLKTRPAPVTAAVRRGRKRTHFNDKAPNQQIFTDFATVRGTGHEAAQI